jgi:hypothetical protein
VALPLLLFGLGNGSSPPGVVAPGGGGRYRETHRATDQERNRRRKASDEDLEALLQEAFRATAGDPAIETAVEAVVEPFIQAPAPQLGALPVVDWGALAADLRAVERLLGAYEEQQARIRARMIEEDALAVLLLAA